MDIRITPRKLSGTVAPPPSKSMAHRVIIAAALSGGISTLETLPALRILRQHSAA